MLTFFSKKGWMIGLSYMINWQNLIYLLNLAFHFASFFTRTSLKLCPKVPHLLKKTIKMEAFDFETVTTSRTGVNSDRRQKINLCHLAKSEIQDQYQKFFYMTFSRTKKNFSVCQSDYQKGKYFPCVLEFSLHTDLPTLSYELVRIQVMN